MKKFFEADDKDRFSESRDQGCKKLVDIVRIYSADETSKRRKNLVVFHSNNGKLLKTETRG